MYAIVCAPVLWSFEVFSRMKENMRKNTEAVSPVVGVMLMLVVTIIIAAVVSAFAGGMASNQQKAPTGTFECTIVNDGTWGGSGFNLQVLAVSEAIPTKDIKLTTSWKASDGTSGGEVITGPVIGDDSKLNTHYKDGANKYHSPLGFGAHVEGWKASGDYAKTQYYGNYTLLAGTTMHNSPYGWSAAYGGYGVSAGTHYSYTNGSSYEFSRDVDGVQAILGEEWYHLMPGDKVNVKLTHIPTGTVLFEKDVAVEG
jgi:FlaG/FlaF family flagellin (archaellin)